MLEAIAREPDSVLPLKSLLVLKYRVQIPLIFADGPFQIDGFWLHRQLSAHGIRNYVRGISYALVVWSCAEPVSPARAPA